MSKWRERKKNTILCELMKNEEKMQINKSFSVLLPLFCPMNILRISNFIRFSFILIACGTFYMRQLSRAIKLIPSKFVLLRLRDSIDVDVDSNKSNGSHLHAENLCSCQSRIFWKTNVKNVPNNRETVMKSEREREKANWSTTIWYEIFNFSNRFSSSSC